MPRTLLAYAAFIALVYLGLCVVLFTFQRSLIYYPQPGSPAGRTGMIALPVDGGEVLVTARPHNGGKALLYFGGNAEDVAYSLPELSDAFPEHAIYLLHYRGYGGSSGNPSEVALFADALALYDRIRANHQHMVVVGRSLGSGVAVYLASQRPVARLVLVTPYDSLVDVAARHYPYFPVRWLLLDKFESSKYAKQVTAPTLVIAAEHDEIIPRASTRALVTRFRDGVVSLKIVPGAGHNTISNKPEYIPLLKGLQ
jgi:pimeloyl-ACP methyl ester carboxylesterase